MNKNRLAQLRKTIFIVAIVQYCLLSTLSAQFWGAKESRPVNTPKDSLKKGEFVWTPELSPQGPILVTVSLDEQIAYVFRNGTRIGMANISTGKSGHETPTGVFVTILKDAKHRSKKYNNAPMPYTQKFTNYGVALHAGGLPGYPSSHGCVHLPSVFAEELFKAAPLGMTVVVTNHARFPEYVDHPFFLSPVLPGGKAEEHQRLTTDEKYRWTPEKSTTGPLSVLVSKADERIVVLRNGIEIGRSRIQFKVQDSVGTNVFVAMRANKEQSWEWMQHTLEDRHYAAVFSANSKLPIAQVNMPEAFRSQLQAAVGEGTTVVITDNPILKKTTGKEMAVLSSHH
ncbi:MAG: L,D-transpeptidase [Chitinophagaceae bacterium]